MTSEGAIPTLIDTLYAHKTINTDLFAIWFAETNGLMTIGGFNTTNHYEDVEYVKLYHT